MMVLPWLALVRALPEESRMAKRAIGRLYLLSPKYYDNANEKNRRSL